MNEMIVKRDFTLDPRTWILKDLRDLIVTKCEQGFTSILMMDANEEQSSKTFYNTIEKLQHADSLH